jgi:beta-lactam-binding protein with PASTA domain
MSVSAPCFHSLERQYTQMHFLLGFLLGYYTRNRPLLAATLTIIALLFFIVLPAIALSGLALSVRRERLSRPPQTRIPQLVGLDYKTAETTLHNAKLNIRVLAHRYDPPVEPGKILFQTPQAGEQVIYGTAVGVIISNENPYNKRQSP